MKNEDVLKQIADLFDEDSFLSPDEIAAKVKELLVKCELIEAEKVPLLYRVGISGSLLVTAHNQYDAAEIAKGVLISDRPAGEIHGFQFDAVRTQKVDDEWLDALPWGTGNEEELTCAELLKRQRKAGKKRDK